MLAHLRPRRAHFITLAVVLVILGPILAFCWRLLVPPLAYTDYAAIARDIVEQNQPPEARDPALPNAVNALLLAEALLNNVMAPYGGPASPFPLRRTLTDPDPVSPNVAVARRVVQELELQGYFDLLAQAAAAPRAVLPQQPGPLYKQGITKISFRDHAAACAWRMRLALETGDCERAARSFDDGLALSEGLTRQASYFDQLLANACSGVLLTEAAGAIAHADPSPPAEFLRGAAAVMDRRRIAGDRAHAIECTRLEALDALQHRYRDWGDDADEIKDALALHFSATHREAAALMDEAFNALLVQAGRRPAERGIAQVNERLARFPPVLEIETWHVRAVLEQLRSFDAIDCHIAGFRTLLAIELFRAEQGRPPATLDDLVPAYIAELPPDPLAADGRFRYRLIDAASDPHARPYLLYSVGLDGEDNGGATLPGRPRSIRAREGDPPFDYIMNQPTK